MWVIWNSMFYGDKSWMKAKSCSTSGPLGLGKCAGAASRNSTFQDWGFEADQNPVLELIPPYVAYSEGWKSVNTRRHATYGGWLSLIREFRSRESVNIRRDGLYYKFCVFLQKSWKYIQIIFHFVYSLGYSKHFLKKSPGNPKRCPALF